MPPKRTKPRTRCGPKTREARSWSAGETPARSGRRTYAPDTGRWLNRDPIGERGGANLYGFVGNEPVGRVDVLGMEYLVFAEDNAEIDLTESAGGTFIETYSSGANAVFDVVLDYSNPAVIVANVFGDYRFSRDFRGFFRLGDLGIGESGDSSQYRWMYCYARCVGVSLFDAAAMGLLSQRPGMHGWLGVLPVTPFSFVLGESESPVAGIEPEWPQAVVGSTGRLALRYRNTLPSARQGWRHMYKREVVRPTYGSVPRGAVGRGWRPYRDQRIAGADRAVRAADRLGKGLAAASLVWDIRSCWRKCAECAP